MSTASIQVGDVIADKYRIESVIGQGAMGVVVSALHIGLQQRVAIKFLLPDIAERESSAERFRREALAAASIRGEHACRVLDVGTHDNGLPYMVMEHLEGHTLGYELSHRGPLPFDEAIHYVLEACEGLAEAHMLGIVHRDIKPANLFLAETVGGSRTLKVLDFGVAKSLAHGSPGHAVLTKTASFVGSPLYISPEQLHSVKDLDARSDVWSLGVVLYELIAGEAPFLAESIAELIATILYKEPSFQLHPSIDLPEELAVVMKKALSKDRSARYGSVGEFALALANLFDDDVSQQSAERTQRILAGQLSRGRSTQQEPGERPTAARRTNLRSRTGASSDAKAVELAAARRRKQLVASVLLLLLTSGGAYFAWRSTQSVERLPKVEASVGAMLPPPSLPLRVEPPIAAPPGSPSPEPVDVPAGVEPAADPAPAVRVVPASRANESKPPTGARRASSSPSAPAPAAAPERAPELAPTPAPVPSGTVRLRDYGGRR